MGAQFFGGVDVGSCTTKAVLLDSNLKIVGLRIVYSATDFMASAQEAWRLCLNEAQVEPRFVAHVISTGYGRKSVEFASTTLTEISCHAKGCSHYFNGPLTIVDIGGQDNKIIKLDSLGRRVSFKMNRKCAAGTGAFLEEMAIRLRKPLEELNTLAESADGEVTLGSYCTVFSATEVLEKIKSGNPVNKIVKGLFRSVVKRVLEMDTMTDKVIITGGVIEHNHYLAEIFKEYTQIPVLIPEHPQAMGALGAAFYASEADV